MRNGRRFHQRYCGSAGFIEGSIKTIEANQHTFTVEHNMSRSSVETSEERGAAPQLPKTNNKHALSAGADEASEPSKLPLSSRPPARNQR